jgi:hypothetical protein
VPSPGNVPDPGFAAPKFCVPAELNKEAHAVFWPEAAPPDLDALILIWPPLLKKYLASLEFDQ